MVGAVNDALYTVDTTTGVATRVGSADQFGVNEGIPTGLTYLPQSTPMPDPDPDPDPMPDPDPTPSGTLYMTGGTNDALYTLNPSTGRATRVGSATRFGVNEASPSGLAAIGNTLYLSLIHI